MDKNKRKGSKGKFVIAVVVVMLICGALGAGWKFGFGLGSGSGKGNGDVTTDAVGTKIPVLKPMYTFDFHFDSDKIFYKKKQISAGQFRKLLSQASSKKEIVQLSFVEATTTNGFVESIKALVNEYDLTPRIVMISPEGTQK